MVNESAMRDLTDQPKDASSGRFICTPEKPMPNPHGFTRWIHPDAKDDERNDPYWDHYFCPNCQTKFSVEVAE